MLFFYVLGLYTYVYYILRVKKTKYRSFEL